MPGVRSGGPAEPAANPFAVGRGRCPLERRLPQSEHLDSRSGRRGEARTDLDPRRRFRRRLRLQARADRSGARAPGRRGRGHAPSTALAPWVFWIRVAPAPRTWGCRTRSRLWSGCTARSMPSAAIRRTSPYSVPMRAQAARRRCLPCRGPADCSGAPFCRARSYTSGIVRRPLRSRRSFLAELGVPAAGLPEIPTDQLLAAQQRLEQRLGADTDGWVFRPVVDGQTLPSAPLAAIRAGEAREHELIVGTQPGRGARLLRRGSRRAQPERGGAPEALRRPYSRRGERPTCHRDLPRCPARRCDESELRLVCDRVRPPVSLPRHAARRSAGGQRRARVRLSLSPGPRRSGEVRSAPFTGSRFPSSSARAATMVCTASWAVATRPSSSPTG